jgi:hypothetical protein
MHHLQQIFNEIATDNGMTVNPTQRWNVPQDVLVQMELAASTLSATDKITFGSGDHTLMLALCTTKQLKQLHRFCNQEFEDGRYSILGFHGGY